MKDQERKLLRDGRGLGVSIIGKVRKVDRYWVALELGA